MNNLTTPLPDSTDKKEGKAAADADGKKRELTVEASADRISTVIDFVNAGLAEFGCDEETRIDIDVAVDELFGNIARYAYPSGSGNATVRMETEEDRRVNTGTDCQGARASGSRH